MLAAVGAGVAYYLHVKHAARDVKGSSTVEFVTTEAAAAAAAGAGRSRGRRTATTPSGCASRTASRSRRRSERVWTFRAQSLVEFPPAVGYGRLFFANNAGVLFAVGAQNGKRAWKFASHRCVAASPALDRHVVYETFLNAPPCNRQPSARSPAR